MHDIYVACGNEQNAFLVDLCKLRDVDHLCDIWTIPKKYKYTNTVLMLFLPVDKCTCT